MDRYTAERKRLEYARVCTKLDVGKEIPRFIEAIMKNGQIASIDVEIPWLPAKCDSCKVFGNSAKTCTKGKKDSVVDKIDVQIQHNNVVVTSAEFSPQNVGKDRKGKDVLSYELTSKFKNSLEEAVKLDSGKKGGSSSRFALLNDSMDIASLVDDLCEHLKQQCVVAKNADELFNAIKPKSYGGKGGLKAGVKGGRKAVEGDPSVKAMEAYVGYATCYKEDSFQARKLDRVMIGNGLLDLDIHSIVEFLLPAMSDHCPALLQPVLRDFNKRYFSNISDQVKAKKEESEVVQAQIMKGFDLVHIAKDLLFDLMDLLAAE
ncbi:hypothetical protein PTKIN_Ptkin16aG0012100 [Pterospermum kingtungense]